MAMQRGLLYIYTELQVSVSSVKERVHEITPYYFG